MIPKKTIKTSSNGDITVSVWAERILIYPYIVDDYKKLIATWNGEEKKAYALFSKAELESKRIGGKLYRRSFAYVELDENGKSGKTIHFMDIAANNLKYAPQSPP